MELLCPWESAKYLFFSSSVPSILYYALLPGMIASILFSVLLFLKNKSNFSIRNLIYLSLLFFIWGFLALILFATNNPSEVMFFWSITILVETLIYLIGVHFTYSFLYEKRLSFNKVFLSVIPILPIIILLSTKFNLIGINLLDCTAIEGPIALYYSYAVEILYSIVILLLVLNKYKKSQKVERKKILYFGIGIFLFLITFSSGNIIGSFTDDWVTSQLGYFGMPVFMGFLAYIVVKYQAFNIKLIATQVLIWGLIILIGSQFLFIKTPINYILNGITFIGILILGPYLIKSVKKEVEQRERLESLRLRLEESNFKLENANDKLKDLDKLKTEFVSLASHQLRSPLTAIKGYTSMLLEGDYGEMNPEAKETVKRVMESSNNLTIVVEDLLNVTKIEAGGMKYNMERFDFGETAASVAKELSINAESKGLKLISNISSDNHYFVNGDKDKLRQIVVNLIDNSMKYTKEGQIEVGMNSKDGKIILTIKDTGVGIEKGKEETLFDKFTRGEGGKLNAAGSGLGLYLVRELAKAHNGRVWAESEGVGKGSTFSVELDEVK
jgi:signal transduction histidine kinase